MSKFKIGDKVTATASRLWKGIEIGDTGIVNEDSNVPYVIWDKNGLKFCISANDIVLSKDTKQNNYEIY